MMLKCLSGRYAGEIREYALHVGLSALKAGTAARVATVPATATPEVAGPLAQQHASITATVSTPHVASRDTAKQQPSGRNQRRRN